ncbi:AAA family ATPase [Thiohalorhabdus sp. Cl-TMA]|uniref:AAA family ATPase n=1 Tax=Thiohalorhabdus methylotrophus TaxID=3242694 RepID=A0ABV4U0L7_9GAMM
MPQLYIRTLGRMAVLRDGEPLPGLGEGKVAALLAYLAVERGQPHERERLAGLFWPEQPGSRARNNLRQSLHQLRRILEGVEAIRSDQRTVRFDPQGDVTVDAAYLEAPLPECTDPDRPFYYAGPFLDGIRLGNGMEELESWLRAVRERFHKRAAAYMERLADCCRTLGRPQDALHYAGRLVEVDPWHEGGHRLIMELLAEQGRREDALVHYHSLADLLGRELGVAPEEETQRLRDRLRGAGSGEVGASEVPVRATHPPPGRVRIAVLACRVTFPGERDPEAAAARIAPMARAVDRVAKRYGARVIRPHGGNFLIYFGLGEDREWMAVHAVRTALQLLEESGEGGAEMEPPFDMRLAVHMGATVQFDAGPEEPDASGMVTGPAWAAAAHAGPGTVLATEPVRRAVREFFQFHETEIRVQDPQAPSSEGSWGLRAVEAERASGGWETAGRLVGRDRELDWLTKCWRDVEGGRGRAVLLRGEAGIGKTRLVRAMAERLSGRTGTVREYRCLPMHQDDPYHPFTAGAFPELLGLGESDDAATRITKIERFLAGYPRVPRQGPYLLGRLFGLPVEAHYPDPGLTPAEEGRRLREVILEVAFSRDREGPQVLVVEDLHWADPSTLAVLERMVHRLTTEPLFLVLTARRMPEWQLSAGEAVELLDIPPLEEAQVVSLIACATGERHPPERLCRSVQEWSDGIPLFALELLREIREAPPPERSMPSMPETLEDIFGARLSRLPERGPLIQLAATIGRDFPASLLAHAAGLSRGELDAALADLDREGILGPIDASGGNRLQFQHVLLQEAAYRSQLHERRRANHAAVAAAIEAHHPDIEKSQPAWLAHHLTEGGRAGDALPPWLQAARQAWRQVANAEAVDLCLKGLEAARTSAADTGPKERELLLILGRARMALRGYSAPEVEAAFRGALDLCAPGAARGDRFQALWGLWLGAATREGHAHALEIAEELQSLAAKLGPPYGGAADYAVGCTAYWLGDLQRVETAARRGAGRESQPDGLEDPLAGRDRVARFGLDPAALSLCYLALAYWHFGYPETAVTVSRDALEVAEAHGHPYSLGAVLAYCMAIAFLRQDVAEVRRFVRRMEQLGDSAGGPIHWGWAWLHASWADAVEGWETATGPLVEGTENMCRGAAGMGATALNRMAEALALLGRDAEARAVVARGLDSATAVGDRVTVPELLLTRGRIRAREEPEAAEQDLRRALTLAGEMGSVGYGARIGSLLGRLLLGQGREGEARRLAAPLHNGLKEGRDGLETGCLGRLL